MTHYDPTHGELVAMSPDGLKLLYWKQVWDGVEYVDEWHVSTDVTPILEENKFIANETANQRWGEWRHVATVPSDMHYNSILHEAHSVGDEKVVKRFLNDSDNSKLRTFHGKL
jgi:hypothetical protein